MVQAHTRSDYGDLRAIMYGLETSTFTVFALLRENDLNTGKNHTLVTSNRIRRVTHFLNLTLEISTHNMAIQTSGGTLIHSETLKR